MTSLGHEKVSQVFAGRPDLIEGIKQAADTPERVILFNSITNFVFDEFLSNEPSAKRRRIEVQGQDGSNTTVDHGMIAPPVRAGPTFKVGQSASPVPANDSLLINLANAAAKEVVLLEVKEISVSIPQRKKYDLVFTKNYLYTKQVGTDAPVQGMVYEWSKIAYVFCAPVPDKQQLMYNYILFPPNTALASTKAWGPVDFEPLLFTVPSSAPKAGVVAGYAAETAAQVSDSYTNLMDWAIKSQLQSVGNTAVSVVGTDPRIFHSNAKQPYRLNEKAVHVKAFRGSKDGYLFFLPNGILWGYKKPLLFIPLDRIVAVSYTNVLQRTFNILVEVDVSHASAQDGQQQKNTPPGEESGSKSEEIEFGMIDQDDYQVIDETYVRRHGLHNRSMAAGRRAKMQLRENAKGASAAAAGGATNGAVQHDGGEDEDMAELERAEQIIEEDEEDEEEEDYDPGSEGESEGEVSTSEEEDDDGEEGEEGDESDEAEGYDEDGVEEEGYAEDHE